jgi:formate hydrogenlyase transcriptional activator
MTTADTLVGVEGQDAQLYKALFELSRAIAGQPDLETLCKLVARILRQVVKFEALALVLHDSRQNQLRLHTVASDRPYRELEYRVDADGESPGARVWRDQKKLVLSPRCSALDDIAVRAAAESGVAQVALLPLSNGDRKLGILGFGFPETFEPDEEALRFLERVASELAVAVDGYLTRQALTHERDRVRALFQITNALVSKLPMEELFETISAQLSSIVDYDLAYLAVVDESTGEARLRGLHSPTGLPPPEETFGKLEGLPAGEVLETGLPVITTGLDSERFPSPLYRRYAELGVPSICSIPLKGRDKIVGILEVDRATGVPYSPEEVQLLLQVSHQVSIAVENALAYQELSRIKDKLVTEKLYLEDEIRFDLNVGSAIGEGPAFKSVLRSIQVVAPTDATVLIQGETGTGKELGL